MRPACPVRAYAPERTRNWARTHAGVRVRACAAAPRMGCARAGARARSHAGAHVCAHARMRTRAHAQARACAQAHGGARTCTHVERRESPSLRWASARIDTFLTRSRPQ
eukprot:2150558-Pleurochrysis_carterae.AAC.1